MTISATHVPASTRTLVPFNLSPAGIAVAIFFFALICYLPLPAGAPLAGTEGHRAMTAHQMVESGQWTVPMMWGRVYLAKPPLHYWIIATFEKISGRATPFMWRLPSAIEASLTAAMLCLFASRWFGRLAGWVAGFSSVAMIALWGENRGADIDVTNTLAANFAALCLIELHFGAPVRKSLWILSAGVAIGASLLVKGPAGMTIILGPILWFSIESIRNRRWAGLCTLSIWLPLLIGAAMFLAWSFTCKHYLKTHALLPDMSGVNEGIQDLLPHDWGWKRAMEWIFLPVTLFLYTLPISIAMPLSMSQDVRGGDGGRPRLINALVMTILLAWGVCFISGMHLPRYAYVTLPIFAVLAGAVAAQVPDAEPRFVRFIRVIAFWSIVIFGGAVLILSVMLWKHSEIRMLLATATVVGIIIAATSAWRLSVFPREWKPLWGLPALLLVLSVVLGQYAFYDRIRRSCVKQADEIRRIVGSGASLVTCQMVLDQPDLFYYLGLPTRATNDDLLDWRPLKSGTWVILKKEELAVWKAKIPERIAMIHPFTVNQNPGYLVRYMMEGATISK